MQNVADPTHHFPIALNNLSPISPKPGTIIPLPSYEASTAPTHNSTPSPHDSAALRTPGSVPNTEITSTRFAPHSRRRCIAASAVAPVAMTGSTRIASSAAAVLTGSSVDEVVDERE